MDVAFALKKYFGYSSFRPLQKEIITSVIGGTDTIALLPTGAGKSICFQLPSLLMPGITLVISPLIALMQDQVETLVKKGIYATYISSTLSSTEVRTRLELIRLQKYKLVYISPERLTQKKFVRLCRKLNISLVVIDEAHCISEWGHDFRPEYLEIKKFLYTLTKQPCLMAVTATATQQTLQDIQDVLGLHTAAIFKTSFARQNLQIRVITVTSLQGQELLLLLLLQKHHGESGIVYVSTRQAAEQVFALVKKYLGDHFSIGYYHGRLPAQERKYTQTLFMSGKLAVVVATSAFGMGIDKGDIRFVIHFQYPSSLEGYYQEIGRGGRDGKTAYCYLLFNANNQAIHSTLTAQSSSSLHQKLRRKKQQSIFQYCCSKKCRTQIILQYFNETESQLCYRCDNCHFHSKQLSSSVDLLLNSTQLQTLEKLKVRRQYLQKLTGKY